MLWFDEIKIIITEKLHFCLNWLETISIVFGQVAERRLRREKLGILKFGIKNQPFPRMMQYLWHINCQFRSFFVNFFFFLPITLAKKVKYLRAEVDDKKLLRQKLFKTIIATFIFDQCCKNRILIQSKLPKIVIFLDSMIPQIIAGACLP